eukprot:scaffold1253_cov146-Amphora_coffeaeformis.AAC.4
MSLVGFPNTYRFGQLFPVLGLGSFTSISLYDVFDHNRGSKVVAPRIVVVVVVVLTMKCFVPAILALLVQFVIKYIFCGKNRINKNLSEASKVGCRREQDASQREETGLPTRIERILIRDAFIPIRISHDVFIPRRHCREKLASLWSKS